MALGELNINDVVEVRIEADSGSGGPAGEYPLTYPAVIKELRSGKFVLSPVSPDDHLNFHPGAKITICKQNTFDVVVCKGIVTAVLQQREPAIIARILANLRPRPRRSSPRVPMQMLVRYMRTDMRGWANAVLKDISEGGARIIVSEKFDLGEAIRLELQFPQRLIYCESVVRRLSIEKLGFTYSVGLEFLHSTDCPRSRLRKLVSEQQSKLKSQPPGTAPANRAAAAAAAGHSASGPGPSTRDTSRR